MSLIAEMKTLLEEGQSITEWEDFLGDLLGFCESVGIELEAEDADELADEIHGWIENGDLDEEEQAKLAEFAAGLKKFARGTARAVGKAVGAYHHTQDKIRAFKAGAKKFGRSVKRAYKSGEKQAHFGKKPAVKKPAAKPAMMKKPGMKKPALRRTVKRPMKRGRR